MKSTKIYAMPNVAWLLPAAVTIITPFVINFSPDLFSRLLWGVLCPGLWLMMLITPRRIELTPEGQVRLDGVLRQTRLNLSDITTVENHGRQVIIRYSGGKITLTTLIQDLHKLPLDLQQRNPTIELKDGVLVRLTNTPLKVFLWVAGLTLMIVAVTFLLLSMPALRRLL